MHPSARPRTDYPGAGMPQSTGLNESLMHLSAGDPHWDEVVIQAVTFDFNLKIYLIKSVFNMRGSSQIQMVRSCESI